MAVLNLEQPFHTPKFNLSLTNIMTCHVYSLQHDRHLQNCCLRWHPTGCITTSEGILHVYSCGLWANIWLTQAARPAFLKTCGNHMLRKFAPYTISGLVLEKAATMRTTGSVRERIWERAIAALCPLAGLSTCGLKLFQALGS